MAKPDLQAASKKAKELLDTKIRDVVGDAAAGAICQTHSPFEIAPEHMQEGAALKRYGYTDKEYVSVEFDPQTATLGDLLNSLGYEYFSLPAARIDSLRALANLPQEERHSILLATHDHPTLGRVGVTAQLYLDSVISLDDLKNGKHTLKLKNLGALALMTALDKMHNTKWEREQSQKAESADALEGSHWKNMATILMGKNTPIPAYITGDLRKKIEACHNGGEPDITLLNETADAIARNEPMSANDYKLPAEVAQKHAIASTAWCKLLSKIADGLADIDENLGFFSNPPGRTR